ncbi:MAG: hypothetical protein ACOYN4_20400, partial [Bacteroidales bacterium]
EFEAKTEVEAGKYLLVTGNRQSDGSVLSSVTFFEVPAKLTTDIKVAIRQDFTPLITFGKINPSTVKFIEYSTNDAIPLSNLISAKGIIMVWIDPDKEPTKHVMADIPAVKSLIENWGGGMVFLFADTKLSSSFKPANFPNLPGQSKFAFDKDSRILGQIDKLRKTSNGSSFPVIAIADKNGNLIYYSEGYKIGIGEQIAKVIAKLK